MKSSVIGVKKKKQFGVYSKQVRAFWSNAFQKKKEIFILYQIYLHKWEHTFIPDFERLSSAVVITNYLPVYNLLIK